MRIRNAFSKSLLAGALALCLAPAVHAQAPTVVNAIGEYDDGTTVQSVCLTYSVAMDPATALSKANYSITGDAITNVQFFTNNSGTVASNLVILQLTNQLTAGYKVNITGVKSAGGTAIAADTSVLGAIDTMSNIDISTTEITTNGTSFGQAAGAYLVDASGNDIWNTADGFHYIYTTRTNSFDIVVQVPYLEPGNQWSKAGLMAREAIDPADGGSRMFYNVTTALGTQEALDGSGDGVNEIADGARSTTDTAAFTPANQATIDTPDYPDVWLRMTRQLTVSEGTTNDVFSAFYSTNGVNWEFVSSFIPTTLGSDTPFPTNTFVGLCTTAHVTPPGASLATVSYTNFGDYVVNVAITTQPQNLTVEQGNQAVFTVVASSSSTVNGGADDFIVWFTNGVVVPGANGSTYSPPATPANNGLKVYAQVYPNGSDTNITSATATLTVIGNTTPPVVVSAGSLSNQLAGYEIGVILSHPLSPATATNLANYSLNNGATITAARYVPDASGEIAITPDAPGGARSPEQQAGVVLSVSPLSAADSYTLTVKNIQDVYGNTLVTTNVPVVASPYTWVSLGVTVTNVANPNGATNQALAVSSNSFNLVNGGNAFWGTEDDITMVYETVNGDFDRTVNVEWSDFASHWARAGIIASASVNPADVLPVANTTAPLYQTILSDPETNAIYDGVVDSPANDQYETNLRYDTGDASTDIRSAGPTVDSFEEGPSYPNSYIRMKRVGQMISVFYSTTTNYPKWWFPIGTTDFSQSSEGLPEQLYVGLVYGCENGNISGQYDGYTGPDLTGTFAARFRNYGTPAQKARGAATMAIGLKFGCDTNINGGSGLQLSTNDIAGANQVAQGNWNNLFGDTTNYAAGTIIGENETTGTATVLSNVLVGTTGSGNEWTTQGPGADGNQNGSLLTGMDAIMMTGCLDSGSATTTYVGITNLPPEMVSQGYDVIVYSMGAVPMRGGGIGIFDTNLNLIPGQGIFAIQSPVLPTNLVQVMPTASYPINVTTNMLTNWDVGNFVVFTNLKASAINVEAMTANNFGFGGTMRIEINAIQIVSPSGLITSTAPPPLPIISVSSKGVITYTGVLRSATSLFGPWTPVSGATSPYTIPAGASTQYFIAAEK